MTRSLLLLFCMTEVSCATREGAARDGVIAVAAIDRNGAGEAGNVRVESGPYCDAGYYRKLDIPVRFSHARAAQVLVEGIYVVELELAAETLSGLRRFLRDSDPDTRAWLVCEDRAFWRFDKDSGATGTMSNPGHEDSKTWAEAMAKRLMQNQGAR